MSRTPEPKTYTSRAPAAFSSEVAASIIDFRSVLTHIGLSASRVMSSQTLVRVGR